MGEKEKGQQMQLQEEQEKMRLNNLTETNAAGEDRTEAQAMKPHIDGGAPESTPQRKITISASGASGTSGTGAGVACGLDNSSLLPGSSRIDKGEFSTGGGRRGDNLLDNALLDIEVN